MVERPLQVLLLILTACGGSAATAQNADYYHPLSQRTPPGHTAAWLQHIRGQPDPRLQPVSIDVAGGARVTVYSHGPEPVASADSSRLFALNPGHTYRLCLTDMNEFPGVELYPTVEVLDRLHPPPGQADRFPVPVPFSRTDIQEALAGNLVTRVIYLEDPETAQELDPLHRELPQQVAPADNVLQRADQLGRPMIIIRLGNRAPGPAGMSSFFYGTGGSVQVRERPSPTAAPDGLSARTTGIR